MTIINATLIAYFIYCKRRMWLHANGIRMEDFSEFVAEGNLIGEFSYPQRSNKYTEVEFSFQYSNEVFLTAKIDFYDAKNKIVHEVKKSNSKEEAHEWQVKFYLWILKLNAVDNASGIIEYPKFRETKNVNLTDTDISTLNQFIDEIFKILNESKPREKINIKYCKNCSYYELCYIDE